MYIEKELFLRFLGKYDIFLKVALYMFYIGYIGRECIYYAQFATRRF